MIAVIVFYGIVNCLLGGVVWWMVILPGQAWGWRLILGLLLVGALVNLAGIIWLDYSSIWPGELALTSGACLAFLGMAFFKHPIVTRGTVKSAG